MAATTGAITFRNCVVEFSTNGSSWTAVSGSVGKVAMSGFDVDTGNAHVFDGSTPLLGRGKRKVGKVTVDAIYTEVASEAWDMANTAYTNDSDLYMRITPKGATTGNKRYTTSAGIVTSAPIPDGDADKGDITKVQLTIECATYTVSNVP